MSRKKKKQLDAKLSLQERLARHWEKRNWSAFVSLFLRDQGLASRTPAASLWFYALANALTQALFADRDMENAAMLADLILSDQEETARLSRTNILDPSFRLAVDCAGVASDFLTLRRDGLLAALSSLSAELPLPPAYASLRNGIEGLCKKSFPLKERRKEGRSELAGLAQKLQTQFAKMQDSKSLTPYTNALKLVEAMRAEATPENAGIFAALHGIFSLLRRLRMAGRTLEDVEHLSRDEAFLEIPEGTDHPLLLGLWELFCRMGTDKYGSEWGQAARMLQLRFRRKAPPVFRMAFEEWQEMNSKTPSYFPSVLKLGLLKSDILEEFFCEQERYLLGAAVLREVLLNISDNFWGPSDEALLMMTPYFFAHVSRIGKKWRPESPLPAAAENLLLDLLLDDLSLSWGFFNAFELPMEKLPAKILLMIGLRYRNEIRNKDFLFASAPLKLTPEDFMLLVTCFDAAMLSRRNVELLKKMLSPEDAAKLLSEGVRQIIAEGATESSDGIPLSRQGWNGMEEDALKMIADTLPSNDLAGCFCRLCVGVKKFTLSNNAESAEAFWAALEAEGEKAEREETEESTAVRLCIWLTAWPNVPEEFIVKLFSRLYFHFDALIPDSRQWREGLLNVLDSLQDRSRKKKLASAMWEFLHKKKLVKKSLSHGALIKALKSRIA